jgi:PPOX class probable F420-dependent enzyme
MHDPVLSAAQRAFLADARRAVLATIAPNGQPRLVPICFVLDPRQDVLYSPLDEKPKAVEDPRRLARVGTSRRTRASRCSSTGGTDWARLAWLRLAGTATLLEPDGSQAAEHSSAVHALRSRYEAYRGHDLESRPMIRIVIDSATSWGALELG